MIQKRTKEASLDKTKAIRFLISNTNRYSSPCRFTGAKIVISRVSKTTIEEAKLKLSKKTDKTEKNIERLLLLSSNRIDPETSDKVYIFFLVIIFTQRSLNFNYLILSVLPILKNFILSFFSIDSSISYYFLIVFQLLNRALRKRYIPKDDKPEEEEKTVFTEADFKQFEEEYQME